MSLNSIMMVSYPTTKYITSRYNGGIDVFPRLIMNQHGRKWN